MGFPGALRVVQNTTETAGLLERLIPSDDGYLVLDVSQIIAPVRGTGARNELYYSDLARFLIGYFYVSFSILTFIVLFLIIYMHVTPYYHITTFIV